MNLIQNSLFSNCLKNQTNLVRYYKAAAGGSIRGKGASEEDTYFYNMQKEEMKKIKKLRAKADQKVKYMIVRPSQIPIVHKLLYESGYPREPMTKHLNLCKGIYSIPDWDKDVENLIKTYNMSILAIDKETNTPLGVAINGEFSIKDTQEGGNTLGNKVRDLTNPDYEPIMAMLHHVDNLGKVVFKEYNTDTIFMTEFLTIKPDVSMEGLATGMLSRVIQQASALGYKGIKTVVSHDGFQKAAMNNGMELVGEIKFNEFSYQGKKVFDGIKVHSSLAFMAMPLD